MENQIIQINLVPNMSTPAVVSVSQYDVGRPLVFKVYDGTSPADLTGVTAVIEGTKRSGLGFSENGTVSDNTVTLNTTLAMTQEDGSIPAEIRFSKTGEDVGTANFILAVEKTPHADGTTDGTQETMADLQSQLNALDTRVDALEAGQSGGLSSTAKQLILSLFSKAAYAEDDASTDYDALEALWTTSTKTVTYTLTHVTSSNTAASVDSGQSYTTTLTAESGYTLNTVSVTMGGVDITSTAYSSGTVSIPSVTGNIVITATAVLAAQSITATYTQSGTVYDTDSLDSLKTDLVVTAYYSGGTSETVPASNYTLSGTLTSGTSTITVTYAGLTDTFNVTVSSRPLYSLPDMNNVAASSNTWVTISNGNHLFIKGTANSRGPHIFKDGTCSEGNNTALNKGTFFTIPQNAGYELRIKNISFSDNTRAGSESNHFSVNFENSGGTAVIVSSGNNLPQTSEGTVADITINGTMENEQVIRSLYIWLYRGVELTFDIELYVNGARWL